MIHLTRQVFIFFILNSFFFFFHFTVPAEEINFVLFLVLILFFSLRCNFVFVYIVAMAILRLDGRLQLCSLLRV